MTDIILHHYDLSPFSEKIRRVLAYKKLAWHAVEQPIMAPKPDLTPLTGGYRRIPVMQIGADIYCDTALIVRVLEARHPEPPVLPAALAGAIGLIEDWADHRLFMFAVPPTLVALMDALPPGFLDDRQAMTPAFSKDAIIGSAPHALEQLRHALDDLDRQLGASPFLLGEAFTLADAACFHPVNFMLNNPSLATDLSLRPALAAWHERITGFGAGEVQAMTAAEALEIARAAEPAAIVNDAGTSADFSLDDSVTIVADDYGQETTTGRVTHIGVNDITVVREDPELGNIAVHYPRAGYRITRAA